MMNDEAAVLRDFAATLNSLRPPQNVTVDGVLTVGESQIVAKFVIKAGNESNGGRAYVISESNGRIGGFVRQVRGLWYRDKNQYTARLRPSYGLELALECFHYCRPDGGNPKGIYPPDLEL